MTDTLSPDLHAALQIIYDAYDRVYDIASHRWDTIMYYDWETKRSTLMGHYVRSLSRFEDHSPEHITYEQFKEYAQPLVDAINMVQATFHPADPGEAYIEIICARQTQYYKQSSTYDRCMSVFRHIERAYPRAIHRDGANPQRRTKKKERMHRATMTTSSYRRPQQTMKWRPYKD
jgi:hypothetical protein